MTAYTVVAPAATVRIGGRLQMCSQGSVLPDGVDAASLAHLLAVGLISELPATASPAPEPETPGDPPAEAAHEAVAERPLQTAPKAAWVDFAATQGMGRAAAEAKTRAELVALLGG